MSSENTQIEKIVGSLAAQSAATALSATVGGPLAALIPLIMSSYAGKKHQERIEAALNDILKNLNEIECELKNISDPSYKLLNDSILCLPHAVQEEKIKYLKTCAINCIKSDRIDMHNATKIGRILRDISVEEVSFLLKYRDCQITFTKTDYHEGVNIERFSNDGNIATGLSSLGLLVEVGAAGQHDAISHFEFNSTAKYLADLLVE